MTLFVNPRRTRQQRVSQRHVHVVAKGHVLWFLFVTDVLYGCYRRVLQVCKIAGILWFDFSVPLFDSVIA